MEKLFSSGKTSAKLLAEYSEEFSKSLAEDEDERRRRRLMVCDLYIKAQSYSTINKIAFVFAVIFGILLIGWPATAVFASEFGFEMEIFKSAIVQTTITAIAALAFAIYAHYKKRQAYVENLMREVVYSDKKLDLLADSIVEKMRTLDLGFSFDGFAKSSGQGLKPKVFQDNADEPPERVQRPLPKSPK